MRSQSHKFDGVGGDAIDKKEIRSYVALARWRAPTHQRVVLTVSGQRFITAEGQNDFG